MPYLFSHFDLHVGYLCPIYLAGAPDIRDLTGYSVFKHTSLCIIIIDLFDELVIVGGLAENLEETLVVLEEVAVIRIAHGLQRVEFYIPFFLSTIIKNPKIFTFRPSASYTPLL